MFEATLLLTISMTFVGIVTSWTIYPVEPKNPF